MRFSHSRQNIKIWRKQISWHKCHIWTVLFYQCAPPPPTTQPVPSDPPPPPIPRLMGGNYSVSDCIHIYTYMSENVFLGKYKCFFIYKPNHLHLLELSLDYSACAKLMRVFMPRFVFWHNLFMFKENFILGSDF